MISQQNHVFISPKDCGSSVGYYLTVGEYEDKKLSKINYTLYARVVLADCTHKIDWSFNSEEVDKLDAAINMLQEFRKKYLDIEKMVSELNK